MYYVTMTDRFMSGWGPASGLLNKFVVACDTLEQAEAIVKAAQDRSEMKHVNWAKKKPYYSPSRYLVSDCSVYDLGGPWLGYFSRDMREQHETEKAKRGAE